MTMKRKCPCGDPDCPNPGDCDAMLYDDEVAGKAPATRETTLDRAKRENAEAEQKEAIDQRMREAAPEMYAALKEIHATLRGGEKVMLGDMATVALAARKLCKSIRALVARIEGSK